MKTLLQRTVLALTVVVIVVAVGGCGRKHFFGKRAWWVSRAIPTDQKLAARRGLAMFSGHTGRRLTWDDVRNAMQWADVILVGEQHDDAVAHQVELALVRDALGMSQSTGVSMEMLERDEQEIVDAYLAGKISREEFVEQTNSDNWGAKGKWGCWYHPIIDAVRDAGAVLIASNSPRKYIREARIEGYGVLWAHPPEERKWYFIPRRILSGAYARRFRRIMTHHPPPRKARPTTMPTSRPAKCPMHRRKPDPNAIFRAQLLWDATMAGSIAQGLDSGLTRVIHLVGQFHIDFDGGTVQYLLDLKPDLKILTISLQRAPARELLPRDKKRADVVIYTPPEPPKDEETDSGKPAD
jgi:uncharacterized iron-regulated protein